MLKQAIIIRKDLEMSVGKKCVQCCHAAIGAYEKTPKKIREKWKKEGSKKVVLEINTKKELIEAFKKAEKLKIPSFLVKDAGLTELKPGTPTTLGIGPEEEEKINKITGSIPLLKD